MITGALTDLAFSLRQQSDLLRMRESLQITGTELTTGIRSDLSENGNGLVGAVFGIDRDLERMEQITFGLHRARAESASAQNALGIAQSAGTTIGVNLLAAISRGDATSTFALQREADQTLDAVVGALNTQVGGRTLFAGTATSGPAIGPASELVADVTALVSGAVDATAAFAAIDAYFFDPGGGFETSYYRGATTDQSGVALPDGSRTIPPPRADDMSIRGTLAALSAVAVAREAPFFSTSSERDAYANEAASRLSQSAAEVTDLRGLFGQTEQRIENGIDAAQAETSAMSMARNDLAGKDPYLAATEFTNLQGQLETLYSVTSRLSSLSLTNYLR